jgi:tetratricopeptide (TPR) repeat protein
MRCRLPTPWRRPSAGRLVHVTANLLSFDEREHVLHLIHQADWNDVRVLRQSPVVSQQLWLCGDQEAALRFLDIAQKRVKSDHRLAYSRAMALQHLGRIEQASSAFEDSIRIAPDFALAHWSLAYHARSRPAGARLAQAACCRSPCHIATGAGDAPLRAIQGTRCRR